jgi:hypothetical protein
MYTLGDNPTTSAPAKKSWAVTYLSLSALVAAASAYHGYRRNRSVGGAVGWFVLGSLFPYITLPVALAQGFGQPKAGLAYIPIYGDDD